MVIGVLQDRLFQHLDKKLFPHKYQIKDQHRKGQINAPSLLTTISQFIWQSLIYILLGGYVLLGLNELLGFMGTKVLTYLFSDTVWAVHIVFLAAIGVTIKNLLSKDS